MPILKTVDKTTVSNSEIFIYTFNVSFSELSGQSTTAKVLDFFPSKIVYVLPQLGNNIVSINQITVPGGKNIEFNFGTVLPGTSITFTVAANFGPGRVDGDSFTNSAQLISDGAVIDETEAETVNLLLTANLVLRKSPTNTTYRVGDEIDVSLRLSGIDSGYVYRNIVIQDVLPTGLSPVLSFIPIGTSRSSSGFNDPTYDGRTGSWDGRTMNFDIPNYNGASYEINFKVTLDLDAIQGSRITNVATWTYDGGDIKSASANIIVFEEKVGVLLAKYGTTTTGVGEPILYSIAGFTNDSTVVVTNAIMTDVLPPEVIVEQFRVITKESIVSQYDVLIERSDNPGVYETIENNVIGNSPIYNVSDYVPSGVKLLSIRAMLEQVEVGSSSSNQSYFRILGKVSDDAIVGSIITNTLNVTVDSSLGSKSGSITLKTSLTGNSLLTRLNKNLVDFTKLVYYPLDIVPMYLNPGTTYGIINNPILSDLLPDGLEI